MGQSAHLGRWCTRTIQFAVAVTVMGAFACAADPPRSLPVWNDGTACNDRPDVEIAWIDPDTAVLRESVCVTREAPFLYLLFGARDALLLDSGDGAPGTPAAVKRLIDEHATRTGRRPQRFVVAHTHAHGDHTRGDAAFRLAGAEVVGLRPVEVARFFGLPRPGRGAGAIELGDRRIAVLAIPGHEPSHVAFHDPRSGYLFTGDTLYPGRLYVPRADFATYQASVRRLQSFATDKGVNIILGAHVEMSMTPGEDFPFEAVQRPNEHPLPLARAHLDELVAVIDEVADSPRVVRRDHFILTPLP